MILTQELSTSNKIDNVLLYINRERKWKIHDVVALVVTPTRELAIQIDEVLLSFTKTHSFMRYVSFMFTVVLCSACIAGLKYLLLIQCDTHILVLPVLLNNQDLIYLR